MRCWRNPTPFYIRRNANVRRCTQKAQKSEKDYNEQKDEVKKYGKRNTEQCN